MDDFLKAAVTIGIGLILFILSQYCLKLMIEPALSLRSTLGELSLYFLKNRAQIYENGGTEEMINDLKEFPPQLLSKKGLIVLYPVAAFLFHLPAGKDVLKACREINGLSYRLMEGSFPNKHIPTVSSSLTELEKILKIKVSYI